MNRSRSITNYNQLSRELQRLLDHPTYQFLEAEAVYYGYVLEQQRKSPYSFQIGNQVFYSVEYFSSTAEDFLENILIPRFREFSTERIAQKRIKNSSNVATLRAHFCQLLEALVNLRPDDDVYTEHDNIPNASWDEEIPYYEETDQLQTLWHAYDALEDYALTLKSVKFIRTHHGPNFKFKIFIDEKQPFVFAVNNAQSLRRCFYFLTFVDFCDLVRANQLGEATILVEKYLSQFLTLTPGITTRFDFSAHCVYCLMGAQDSFSFNKYSFDKLREFIQLLNDVNHFRYKNNLDEKAPNQSHVRKFNNNILITNTSLTDATLFVECDETKGYHFTK